MHAGDLVTDARDIGALYLQSFPESIDFFFPGRDPDTLLPMIGWGFELLLRTGCHRIVIRDCDGSLLGYCLVSTTKTVPFYRLLWLTGSTDGGPGDQGCQADSGSRAPLASSQWTSLAKDKSRFW